MPVPLRFPTFATNALAAAVLAGCATGPQASPDDPLEPMNRAIFTVNDKLDQYVATPVAKGYRAATPEPVRTAVSNFYSNLADIGNFANNLLQGKGVAAAESFMRVAMNSVLGLGGLIDIATPAGLAKHAQDFGLTLGTWGVPSGPYLVLPVFGPSSLRDGAGLYVNFWFDPTTYAEPAVRNSLFGMNVIDVRTNLLGATDLLKLAALDRYAFVRDAYLQRRRYLLGENTALPDYGDDEDAAEQPAAPAAAGTPAPAQPQAPR
ncbi:MlaA family lipoprotein [Cupriavidus neocaledonicus]|uniref:Lipoprotein vacJ n=1 Tax=Cupriavidus neocaledonicus TaxID=1040979 RepID=A0A375HQ27_9BURK|nr:VacJ family lipoprotein [Cupriavidus neocaledonicus]SOZ39331.1 Lipoprotein vacJ precursor [Cupriavidus neocaledonicus]SPD58954.1 Lipoprotein vacJ [Cupriavidus neocaledonicus]